MGALVELLKNKIGKEIGINSNGSMNLAGEIVEVNDEFVRLKRFLPDKRAFIQIVPIDKIWVVEWDVRKD